ncbi:hypothetical protein [Antrihabitans spumae]|uniref:Uncharacterized protein n=1 Tax=Antrihabitans spumae TaxID=3373370 RepID=A0ABW7JMD4_9NOCA
MTSHIDAAEANDPKARVLSSLQSLAVSHADLAGVLADLITVVANEADRNSRFARQLSAALLGDRKETVTTRPHNAKRARRNPGPWDPNTVYADVGEGGLRSRLETLDLEQLRNIVAEHGMDTDRLAMKWRNPERVIDRILERVVNRATKGDGFRNT